jgi:hypothetical protein
MGGDPERMRARKAVEYLGARILEDRSAPENTDPPEGAVC